MQPTHLTCPTTFPFPPTHPHAPFPDFFLLRSSQPPQFLSKRRGVPAASGERERERERRAARGEHERRAARRTGVRRSNREVKRLHGYALHQRYSTCCTKQHNHAIHSFGQRNHLLLRAGKRGSIEKVGEFTMTYVETPNISEIRWVPDPNNSKKYVREAVISPYSRIFPPLL
ncbi:hypothetical protein NL676_039313 [Syzygium grande]|nr:hypothetical protein NL676_039313 [Syzygium grande]